MATQIGSIEALFRYPVKSMRGESLDAATMGWHGIEGDRRLALRRVEERGGNPWLSAGRLPDLVGFAPLRKDENDDGMPSHVRTPDGGELPLFSNELAAEIERRHGAPVQVMQLRHGIFDESNISVIAASTVDELGRLSDTDADVRRFRPNIFVRTTDHVAFEEDDWVGGTLVFGTGDDGPAISVMMRDERCSMVNLDPDGQGRDPAVMKACVQANGNHAGVYCTVTRIGRLGVGQPVFLHR